MRFRPATLHLAMTGLSLMTLFMIVVAARPALAGPITNPTTPPTAPFVKLGVYQGLVSVMSGTNALEIGNAGRDIAATGNIYLLPGGHTTAAGGIVIKQSPNFLQAAIDVGNTGRICLNTNQAGAYACVDSWLVGSVGDTFWTATPPLLSPKVTSPVIDTIQIGYDSTPVPAANGRAVDIYTNNAAPALDVAGDLETGYFDPPTSSNKGGNVRVTGGQVLATSNSPFQIVINGSWIPWSSRDVFNPITFVGSQLDADTFDSAAIIPPPSDHNLFWRDVPAGKALCLNLNPSVNALCTGGTNAGTDCSTPGPGPAACLGGGTCSNMCKMSHLTCQNRAARCVFSGSGADTGVLCPGGVTQCNGGVGQYCIVGNLLYTGVSASSFCTGIAPCSSTCASGQTICNGTAGAPPACSGFGETVYADTGTQVDCVVIGATPNFQRVCDCHLGASRPYWAYDSNGAAQICSPATVGRGF